MITISKRHKYETGLLDSLNERNYPKLAELMKAYTHKYGSNTISKLLHHELRLEEMLSEVQQITDATVDTELVESIEKFLTGVTANDGEKESYFKVFEESRVLLMKVHLLNRNYDKCLNVFKMTSLNDLKQSRRLMLVSEAFAMKGVCASKIEQSSAKDIVNSYETCFIYFLKLLTREVHSGNGKRSSTSSRECQLSTINMSSISFCLLTAAKNYVEMLEENNVNKVISMLRLLLTATKSQNFGALDLRQYMSYKLANLLSVNTCKSNYPCELNLPGEFESFRVKQDLNSFKHDVLVQEQVLSLKVSETLLNVDPLLDMSPTFESARSELLKKADGLYNLSVVTMLPQGFHEYLLGSLKPAYKYMFDHGHLWKTTALLSCQSPDNKAAIAALTESFRVNEDPYTAMLLARKCYNLQEPDCELGIKYSLSALKHIEEQGLHEIEKSKALISLGVGKSLKSGMSALVKDKHQLQDEALGLFEEAIKLDSYDPLPHLCAAKVLAENREIDSSFKKVREALILDPECLPALQLVILILTAKKNYQGALESLKDSLGKYPHDKLLMAIKCHTELHLGFKDSALKTCLDFFKLTRSHPSSLLCNVEDLNDLPRSLKGDQASENQSTILGICSNTTTENQVALAV